MAEFLGSAASPLRPSPAYSRLTGASTRACQASAEGVLPGDSGSAFGRTRPDGSTSTARASSGTRAGGPSETGCPSWPGVRFTQATPRTSVSGSR